MSKSNNNKSSISLLKQYAQYMEMQDYISLKKELKILQIYRKYSLLRNVNNVDTCILGEFHIDEDCDDFEYFLKNEILKEEDK